MLPKSYSYYFVHILCWSAGNVCHSSFRYQPFSVITSSWVCIPHKYTGVQTRPGELLSAWATMSDSLISHRAPCGAWWLPTTICMKLMVVIEGMQHVTCSYIYIYIWRNVTCLLAHIYIYNCREKMRHSYQHCQGWDFQNNTFLGLY